MRKILLLTKTMLKSGGGMSSGTSKRSKWVLPLVLLFAFASFGFSMVFFTIMIYDSMGPAHVIILPLIFGATSVVTFLFGIFYTISVMYHADDVEQLKYMPLRPYHILGAKFITLVIYEYIFEAFILAPVLVAYGIKSGAGAAYILYCALLFLITPVIALSMASVLVMIVMRFTSFGKNKQAFKFVGGILAMALAIGFNIFMQTSVANLDEGKIMQAFMNSTLPETFGSLFPGISFASRALADSGALSGLWNLLLFVLCSAGAVAVFMGAGQLLYLKGVAGITESSAKRKGVKDLERETESASSVSSYIKKEMRLLFRSPIAFMNCVLMTFIWPVLIVIIFMSGGTRMEMMSQMFTQMDEGLLVAIIVGSSAFISSSNAITSTAISREGKSLYFMKYIPMSMHKQLLAKNITGMVFSGISVVLLAGLALFMGAGAVVVIASLVIGLIVMAATSYAGLLIDIGNPKLQWVNEQQAIKQNVNVVLHMLVGVLFGAIAIVPAAVLGTSLIVSILYCLAVFALLLVIFRSRVNTKGSAKLINMDV